MLAGKNQGASRDPERLGKTGGRPKGGRGGIPSVTKLLGKALGKGWMKRAKGGSTSWRTGGGAGRVFRQRVIVKALVVRHGRRAAGGRGGSVGMSRGGASLTRHVRYLGREGTSEKGERGQFYDRDVEGLDAGELTKAWHAQDSPDPHHFRLIISPEKGDQIADLTGYVREVMGRVERDLQQAGDATGKKRENRAGKQLEWIAINHFNTEKPHAHVLIRGVTGPLIERSIQASSEVRGEQVAEGQADAPNPAHRAIDPAHARVLILPREVVSHGIRNRAEEVATELLGERSLEEVRHAREKEVGAERWTGLDRQIARQIELQNLSATTPTVLPKPVSIDPSQDPAAAHRIDIAPDRLAGVRTHERGLLVRRLQTLQQYGLATPTRGSIWQVEPDFRQRLITVGARADIIKTLYGTLGAEAGRVVPYGLADRLAGRAPQPLEGVVVGHGVVDEMTLERYLVVRDRRGQDHYAAVREGEAYDRVQKGATVALGTASHERQQGTDELIRVAEASPGKTYSPSAHRADLSSRSDLFAADRQRLLDLASRQAEQLAGRAGTGVERDEQDRTGVFKIDTDLLRRHAQRQASRAVTDVRVLAGGRDLHERADRGAHQNRGRSPADRFSPEPGRSAPSRGRSRPRERSDRDDMELGD